MLKEGDATNKLQLSETTVVL